MSRFTSLGTSLATGLLVLTATTWAATEDGDDPYTLWGLVAEGWVALLMLAFVAGTALATCWLFLAEPPTRMGHLAMVFVSLTTAVWVLVVEQVPPEQYDSAPGRWLTLLGALALAGVHGFRAEELSPRGSG
jgi:hypothetical protein